MIWSAAGVDAELTASDETRMVTFDPKKDATNVARRGLPFVKAEEFDWSTAVIKYDRRRDYGEERFVATGLIEGRPHVLVFTPRDDDIRVISLRRANKREQATYARRPLPDR